MCRWRGTVPEEEWTEMCSQLVEMGVDVFFNARHVLADELGGGLHAPCGGYEQWCWPVATAMTPEFLSAGFARSSRGWWMT